VSAGSVIRVVSTSERHIFSNIQGHTDHVTSLVQCPDVEAQFYSSALDGCVLLWDIGGRNIDHRVVCDSFRSFLFIIINNLLLLFFISSYFVLFHSLAFFSLIFNLLQ
jgi:hypothetical protein